MFQRCRPQDTTYKQTWCNDCWSACQAVCVMCLCTLLVPPSSDRPTMLHLRPVGRSRRRLSYRSTGLKPTEQSRAASADHAAGTVTDRSPRSPTVAEDNRIRAGAADVTWMEGGPEKTVQRAWKQIPGDDRSRTQDCAPAASRRRPVRRHPASGLDGSTSHSRRRRRRSSSSSSRDLDTRPTDANRAKICTPWPTELNSIV